MGISSFSSFEGSDLLAFVVCGGIGYFVGTLAPDGAPSVYISILVAYHLFLAWLIFGKTANYEQGDKQAGLSLPLRHTLLTHTACLVVILAPVSIALHSMQSFAATHPNISDPFDPTAAHLAEEKTEHTLRLIKGVCCSMAGLAVFERRWLFNSESPQKPKTEPLPRPFVRPPTTVPIGTPTSPRTANPSLPAPPSEPSMKSGSSPAATISPRDPPPDNVAPRTSAGPSCNNAACL
jgi:hypothetical protein